jgi:hypothetical protein
MIKKQLSSEQCLLLEKIQETWKLNQNLRYGQMLCIIIKSGKTQFYLTDEELCKKIDEFNTPLP